jgi:transmembrane sensor
MTPRAQARPSKARLTAAAQWIVRLQEAEPDDTAIADWIAWCEADPLNRLAFDAMAEVHELAGGIEPAEAPAARPRPVQAPPRRRWPVWTPTAIAASLAVVAVLAVAGGSLVAIPTTRPAPAERVSRLETGPAAHQGVDLVDGSRVEIGGRTALSVRYTAQTRLIVADRGEMFFRVAHNRERPFVVEAGPVTVTAVGTAFSVEREQDSVSVAVTEGIVDVRVSPALKAEARGGSVEMQPMLLRVSAGQRIRFDRGELTQSAARVDPDLTASWRQGRLEFRDEPLRLVAARINRYSVRQIVITNPSIEDLRVTGVVYTDRIDSWLEGLQQVLPVKVSDQGEDQLAIAPATGPRRQAGG